MRVAGLIREELTSRFAPERLEIVDESHRHEGHAGARPGGETHFRVTIVSHAFARLSRVERQRLVYEALGELMRTDIHALALTVLAPGEGASAPRGR